MKFAIDNVIDSWFDGITAAQVTEALAGLKDGETLELSINSPGGDVYEGIAIFNAIREVAKTHPVVVTINGLAASMASYIALAARTVDGNAVVKASDNSIFMIHNPYTGMYGDYKKFEKTASYLKQLAGALSGVYQSVSKKAKKISVLLWTKRRSLSAMKFLKTDLQMNLKNMQLQNKMMMPTLRLLKAVMRLL